MRWCSMRSDPMRAKKNEAYIPFGAGGGLFLRVQFWRLLFLAGFAVLGAVRTPAQDVPPRRTGSQVIDDTTKQIYGPNTSRYFYEHEVFYNRPVLHAIDTFIHNYHRNSSYVQKYNNLYQDLGNIGTAIRPIYEQAPTTIGASTGFHAYDLYWDTESVRYFDTKSPYTNMQLVLGGKGRSLTRAAFSRNVNPRWNVGFNYRGLFVDKQIQRRGKNDRITRSNYYDIYTTYQNKDSTYRLFINHRRMYHRVNEFGGVQVDTSDYKGIEEYFDINARPWLTTASTEDLRTNFHIFHEYKIGSALQFYHTLDRYKQKNKFLDLANASQAFYYNYVDFSDSDSVRDATTIRTLRNEVGIKGNLLKLFYNGYYALRHYHMKYNHLPTDSINLVKWPAEKGDEHFLGGRMSLDLDSLMQLRGLAEFILVDQDQASEEFTYRLEGSLHSKWLTASLKQLSYKPSYLAQAYRGRHDYWDVFAPGSDTYREDGYRNVEMSQLSGFLHYRNSVLSISPGVTFSRFRNYVFFDQSNAHKDSVQQVLPVQSDGNQILASPEVRASLTFFRHITLTTHAIYTLFLENADDAIRVPELFANAQLSYSNIFFNGNLDMHGGVDLHWKSAYYAPGYDVATQQFYNQDVFESPAFPLVDLFFNAKIKRARIFFKYNNILQIALGRGYLPTPYYPGQRSIFDFGFDWSFYD